MGLLLTGRARLPKTRGTGEAEQSRAEEKRRREEEKRRRSPGLSRRKLSVTATGTVAVSVGVTCKGSA